VTALVTDDTVQPPTAERGEDMKRIVVVAAVAVAVVSIGCQKAEVTTPAWFEGSFEEALSAAQARGTMMMLDFYSPN
jgi:hypothetical protein